jgi:hypothetical protein
MPFLITNENNLPANFPIQLFLNILETVMRYNIFFFGETYWNQESGTAMGTPAACEYATKMFGHYENTTIFLISLVSGYPPPGTTQAEPGKTLKHSSTTGAHWNGK